MKNQYVQIQNWSNVKNLKYALWRDFFMNKNFRNLVAYAFIVMMPIFLVATIFSWQVNVAQAVKCSDSNNAPYDMSGYRSNVGSTYQFKIQAASGGSTGWGTDVYTQDSRLDFMVIHAGALTVGQTGIVRVTVLGPQSSYTGSARNYIRTSDYGYINGISYSVVLQQACTSPDYFAYCNVTTDTNYGGYSCHGTCYNGNGNYPTCTLPAATYSCSGTQPSNSSMWDSTTGLPSSASYTYSSYNSSTQCEYYCNSGYTWNGSSCAAPTYSCSGTQPSNSSMWDSTTGLPSSASYTYSSYNSSAQCEYSCNSGYTWNGSSCAAPTYSCSGTQPSNSSMWDATSGLTSPASYVYSGSNTSAQCEYACASGYTLSGGSCVPISATVTNFKICLNSCTSGSPYSVPPSSGLEKFSFGLSDPAKILYACSGAADCITSTNTPVPSTWSANTDADGQNAVDLEIMDSGRYVKVRPKSTGAGKSDIIKATPQ